MSRPSFCPRCYQLDADGYGQTCLACRDYTAGVTERAAARQAICIRLDTSSWHTTAGEVEAARAAIRNDVASRLIEADASLTWGANR